MVRSHALYPTELRARVGITEGARFYHATFNCLATVWVTCTPSSAWKLAERVGFEPTMELSTPYSLSRGAPSAARPPLLNNHHSTADAHRAQTRILAPRGCRSRPGYQALFSHALVTLECNQTPSRTTTINFHISRAFKKRFIVQLPIPVTGDFLKTNSTYASSTTQKIRFNMTSMSTRNSTVMIPPTRMKSLT